tara:strand:- start:67 stop:621 length:555 start_codon:yes stop_codon:yes gene_type:complete
MKLILICLSVLFLSNCSKPKTVLICGDHVCINKKEADQFFQENLSIEVRLVDKKDRNGIDLVELNLKENQNGQKKIIIKSKKNTNKDLKILSNEEITVIKEKMKIKNKKKKIVSKKIKKKQKVIKKEEKIKQSNNKILESIVPKKRKDVVDVCTILEKCNIDEISKYLLKQSKKKGFPDITLRQ